MTPPPSAAPTPRFASRRAGAVADAVAPDGSQVHLLVEGAGGGMALFVLPPGAIAKPVAHRSVEELWYVASGRGRIWRRLGDAEEVLVLEAGLSLSIPVGMHFQFRCDGPEPLVVLGATMPPWPGAGEAYPVPGKWQASVNN